MFPASGESSVDDKETFIHKKQDLIPVIFKREDRLGKVLEEESEKLIDLIRRTDILAGKIILLPEYSFYSRPNLAEPIDFSSNEISGQQSVLSALDKLKEISSSKDCIIIASSLSEKIKLDTGRVVCFSTTVIINPNGETFFRRKADSDMYLLVEDEWMELDSYSKNILTNEEAAQVLDLSLGTVRSFKVFINEVEKNLGIIICSEAYNKEVYKNFPAAIDYLLVPISDGSVVTEDIARDIYMKRAVQIADNLPDGFIFPEDGLRVVFSNERELSSATCEITGNKSIKNLDVIVLQDSV